MKIAIKLNPKFYDCYYGIGDYNYWVSEKLGKYVPFFDKRETGIRQLESTNKGIFSPMPGKIALCRVYITEKRYDEVIALGKEIFSAYPNSLVLRWKVGLALVKSERWRKAKKHYQWITAYLEPIKLKGLEASIEAWYYLALSRYHLDEYGEAKKLLDKILSHREEVDENLFFMRTA